MNTAFEGDLLLIFGVFNYFLNNSEKCKGRSLRFLIISLVRSINASFAEYSFPYVSKYFGISVKSDLMLIFDF